jgi:ABC-type oligopeptide transport system substrate-binding subunit
VASQYSIAADGAVYKFTVRPNVTFSNGNPVTADTLRYSRSPRPSGSPTGVSDISGDVGHHRDQREPAGSTGFWYGKT